MNVLSTSLLGDVTLSRSSRMVLLHHGKANARAVKEGETEVQFIFLLRYPRVFFLSKNHKLEIPLNVHALSFSDQIREGTI